MQASDLRVYGHRFVDWMADYLESIETLPVRSPVAPGATREQLPEAPPREGESMDAIFEDFRSLVLPGMTHWQHPGFFAYFPANSSVPSVLAEMLTATLAAQCMSWETSPAATELEEVVMEWLRAAVGLPEGFIGSIQDTASVATLLAVLTARERVTDWASNDVGLGESGRGLTAYASTEAHSSVERAVKVAGLGARNLRQIPVDRSSAMLSDELDAAIRRDVASGRRPACVVATLGTTGTAGIDPLREIGDVCRRHGVWLHVDAAWAGSALVLPECRGMLEGIEHVDSFVFNPHKWLFTNFDCSAYFVRDVAALLRTFSILPEYLRTRDAGVTNFRDWGIQLGRRFRALKLWFVLRSFGLDGLRRVLRSHIDMARELGERIADAPDFDLVVPPTFGLVGFRYAPPGHAEDALDAINERLVHALNDGGEIYVTHTRLRGRYVVRLVVGQLHTERRHVESAWDLIRRTARGEA